MIGKTVSHYRITRELGAGGMGVVYEAVDTKLDRTVALKFLPPESTRDPDAKARFVHEAKAASALDHNNVCVIYEIDETDDGQLFLAMARYEGETLKERIARGPLLLDDALDITRQVAEGLTKAHVRDIVHRDIKPANIFITKDGVVKILDFGLAKLAGQTQLTKTGTTLGTGHYMSPEQAGGHEADHRSDLWSLGVVLYEMVSGRIPFQGDHAQAVVYAVLNSEPEPVTGLRTGVPVELERLIGRCLEKEPEARYQTAGDLGSDLGRVQRSLDSVATPTVAISTATRPRRRWPWPAGAAVALALVLVFVIYPRLVGRSDPPSDSGRRMLVVLPFENLGAPEDEYFADGITDELTARLAKIVGLGVIARTSAVHYKNTDKTMHQIGEELNVEYVLEGTIRWEHLGGSQSRIRVTPQLIRVSDATHLWADIYQRDMTSIFEVQTDIAEKVAAALNIQLLDITREAIDARPTENLEAYNAYLQGIDMSRVPDYRQEAREVSVQMFERAVELDPEFAPAYAQLSIANSGLYNLGFDRTKKRVARSKAAVDRALELEPNNAKAHMALAYYYYWCHGEYDLALEQFAIAEEGLPNEPGILQGVAFILRRKGHYEESVAKLKTALEFSPQDSDLALSLGGTLAPMRRYEEAEEYLRLSIALAPGQNASYHYLGWLYRIWNSDTVKARAILEKIPLPNEQRAFSWYTQCMFERDYDTALDHLDLIPSDRISVNEWWYSPWMMLAGLAHRLSGDMEKAEAAFETARIQLEATITDQPEDSRMRSSLGIIYAGLGRKEDAIREGKLATELLPVSKDAYIGPRHIEKLALVYTMVGEYEAAFDEIEYLLSIPCYFSVGLLRLDPKWDPLRVNPRYQKLVDAR